MLRSEVNKEPPWWAWMAAIMIIMLSVSVTFDVVSTQVLVLDAER